MFSHAYQVPIYFNVKFCAKVFIVFSSFTFMHYICMRYAVCINAWHIKCCNGTDFLVFVLVHFVLNIRKEKPIKWNELDANNGAL